MTFNVNDGYFTNTHEFVRFLDEYLSFKAHCEQLVSKLNFLGLNLRSVLKENQLISI